MPKLGLALSAATLGRGNFPPPKVWDAYSDFYLSPTAPGWGGATSPSELGSAWGYYAGNVNGFGFPTSIGTYLTSGQIYKLANPNPGGASDPTRYSNSVWYDTGGAGFAAYSDSIGWGVSVGRFDNPWFSGAPGWGKGESNLIWAQPAWLGVSDAEGIAAVLTWTVPENGTYKFSGKLLIGDQPLNACSAAIVDSLGAVLFPPALILNDATYPIPEITRTYEAGVIIQVQIGSSGSSSGVYGSANAVGLGITIVK